MPKKDKLTPKNIKPRMTVLRVMRYKEIPVYIRKFNDDIFTYDVIYKNELYSSYMVFTPKSNQTKLSKKEIESASSLLWAGAVATINGLLGIVVDKEKAAQAKAVISATLKN
jgi:hypothetical protein